MTIKAILFDMDYTLLDRDLAVKAFSRLQFSRHAQDEHLDSMVEQFHRRDLKGFNRRHEVYADVANAFGYNLPIEDLVREFENEAWEYAELYDGVTDLLNYLRRRKILLGIITNGSAKVQNLKVESVRLRERVDTVLIAGEVSLWKPDPRAFEHVCIAMKVSPEACVFVGDTPLHDIVPARDLGMTTVWRRAHHSWPDDVPVAYDYAVDDVTEILDLPILRG